MNMYRLYFKLHEVESNFVTKAETCQDAVGKWLMAMKNTSKVDDNIVVLCQKILNDSLTDRRGDFLLYDSEDLQLHCEKSMEIDPEHRNYEPEDSVIYTHQNLPERLKFVLSQEDVMYILDLNYQYMEENGFILEDGEKPDPEKDKELGLHWDNEIVSAYVQKKALEQGYIYAFEDIQDVFEAEMEYMKTVGIIDDPDDDIMKNDDAIDLSKIKPN